MVIIWSHFCRQALNEAKKQNHGLLERVQGLQNEVADSDVRRAELEGQLRQSHTVSILHHSHVMLTLKSIKSQYTSSSQYNPKSCNANTVGYQNICVCFFRCWCRDKRESRTLTRTFRRSAQRNSCCTSESRNCLDIWPISRPRNLRWSAPLPDWRKTSLP